MAVTAARHFRGYHVISQKHVADISFHYRRRAQQARQLLSPINVRDVQASLHRASRPPRAFTASCRRYSTATRASPRFRTITFSRNIAGALHLIPVIAPAFMRAKRALPPGFRATSKVRDIYATYLPLPLFFARYHGHVAIRA